jgi:glycosyltransferase involved in cell wall biosynthesis
VANPQLRPVVEKISSRMTPKKNLMLIIPELSVGGAQRSLAKLSIELSQHTTVFLVVFNNKHEVAYPVGGEIFSLDVVPGSSAISKLLAFRDRVTRLRALKRKLNIDVAISFLEGADYVNVLSKVKEKVVLSVRGSKLHDENMLRYFYWLRNGVLIPWLYKAADVIVAVNKGIAIELKDHHHLPQDKIVTIGNFYDRDAIVKMSNEPKEKNIVDLYKRKILVTTGRLAVEKGISGLIAVFSKVLKERRDICLVIVGDGPEKNSLKQSAIEKGLHVGDQNSTELVPDVVFVGNQNNVFKYLRGAALYLMNSSAEGFPNGLVEAMICGVPVISSDCPYGPAEILAPEREGSLNRNEVYRAPYGILMPIISGEEYIEIWVRTILESLDNESMLNELSADAFERTNDFDRGTVVQQWLHIIVT